MTRVWPGIETRAQDDPTVTAVHVAPLSSVISTVPEPVIRLTYAERKKARDVAVRVCNTVALLADAVIDDALFATPVRPV